MDTGLEGDAATAEVDGVFGHTIAPAVTLCVNRGCTVMCCIFR